MSRHAFQVKSREFGLDRDQFPRGRIAFDLNTDRSHLDTRPFGLNDDRFQLHTRAFELDNDRSHLDRLAFDLDTIDSIRAPERSVMNMPLYISSENWGSAQGPI